MSNFFSQKGILLFDINVLEHVLDTDPLMNYHNSFLCETLKQYHQLPKELRDIKTIHAFTKKCKELLHKNKNPQHLSKT